MVGFFDSLGLEIFLPNIFYFATTQATTAFPFFCLGTLKYLLIDAPPFRQFFESELPGVFPDFKSTLLDFLRQPRGVSLNANVPFGLDILLKTDTIIDIQAELVHGESIASARRRGFGWGP